VLPSIEDQAATLVERAVLRQKCIAEPGLTEAELDRAETTFGLVMPPLWRAVLRRVHPVEVPMPPRNADDILIWTRFPDWRLRDREATAQMIDWPVAGVLFDVEHHDFWWHAWGPRPRSLLASLRTARARLEALPRLTPLWINLYVANTDRSPVFSIHQADPVIMATTLDRFRADRPAVDIPIEDYPLGDVPFWSELTAWAQLGDLEPRFGDLATAGSHR
jgi:hypothetical protein